MENILRYCAKQALPKHRYIPGKGPKDENRKDIPHFHLVKLTETSWQLNDAYLYGVDLYNQNFLFEAHEVWEELWLFSGKASPEGRFLKALIQLAAARLKRELAEARPAQRLIQSALKIFEESLNISVKQSYMGIALSDLIEALKNAHLPSRLNLSFE